MHDHTASAAAADCPSCASAFAGPYCHRCGEERMDAHAWTWSHFTHHLMHELLHVDSKIFRSFWYLIARPGLLTQEYWAGRRVPYLRPLRIYLIAAAIHFLALHYGWFRLDTIKLDGQDSTAQSLVQVMARAWKIDPARDAELTARFEAIYRFVAYLGPLILAGFSWAAFRAQRPYYVQHLILALHVYSFWFLLSSLTGSALWLRGAATVATSVYLFFVARRLFGGGIGRNLGRAIFLRAAVIIAELVVIVSTLAGVILWAKRH